MEVTGDPEALVLGRQPGELRARRGERLIAAEHTEVANVTRAATGIATGVTSSNDAAEADVPGRDRDRNQERGEGEPGDDRSGPGTQRPTVRIVRNTHMTNAGRARERQFRHEQRHEHAEEGPEAGGCPCLEIPGEERTG